MCITSSIIKAQTITTFSATNVNVTDTLTSGVMIDAAGITASDTIKAQDHVVAEHNLQVKGDVILAGQIQLNNNSGLKVVAPNPVTGNGKIIILGNHNGPPGGDDPSACIVNTGGWFTPGPGLGIFASYSNTSTPAFKSTLSMLVEGSGDGFIDIGGSVNGSNPGDLFINQKCVRNTKINLAGGGVFMGDQVRMNKFVEIGPPNGASTGFGSPLFKINLTSGTAMEVTANGNNIHAYSILYNTTNPYTVFGDGRVQLLTPQPNSKMFSVGDINAITNADRFAILGDGRTQIGNPVISNVVGGIGVQPFLLEINGVGKSGIKINTPTSIGNGNYNDPRFWIGDAQTNQDKYLIFDDGTTYIGDRWNQVGTDGQIFSSIFPKFTTQANPSSNNNQNRAAFFATVKNQNINESLNQIGYVAVFHSDNKNSRAISVMCSDPSLNLPTNSIFEGFRVYADGRTYIGGPKVGGVHSTALLQVSGEIVCKSLYVIKPASWQDKVFNKDYNLMELSEVEQFITKNKHLPGIKSEKEILENGYDVNEVDASLLEKIENLYLYVIKQEKEINELKKKLNEKN